MAMVVASMTAMIMVVSLALMVVMGLRAWGDCNRTD
jgi:hypothetical protein